ncbi:AC3 protein [Conyza yellow vein virus]|nr:AC3 protein [Conyza yellow vein virus]UED37342.1 AC3 protein [Conyza yellow vein virus]
MDFRTGENITAAQAENGVHTWEIQNPLYFKIIEHLQRPMLMDTDIIKIRIQFNYNLRKALGIHQCFLTWTVWTRLQPQTSHFLRVFRNQCIRYLDNVGVICINNVIRAVRHLLYDKLEGLEHVNFKYIIKFKLY